MDAAHDLIKVARLKIIPELAAMLLRGDDEVRTVVLTLPFSEAVSRSGATDGF